MVRQRCALLAKSPAVQLRLCLLASVCLWLLRCTTEVEAAYTVIDLGTIPGFSNSQAIAVHDGQVVGWASTSDGLTHAFSWTQAAGMIDLGVPGGFETSIAMAVSNGQVVGMGHTPTTISRATLSSDPSGCG